MCIDYCGHAYCRLCSELFFKKDFEPWCSKQCEEAKQSPIITADEYRELLKMEIYED